jgi:2-oxoisovalerate dehydrogenase E2 component (dihydrolipoyl transacylase)
MDFRLPELGEGVYEAEVVRWLVKPGDTVKRAQVLVEVLTDKATMEVPAAFAGTIENLNAEPGQQVKIGAVLLTYKDKTSSGAGEEPKVAETARRQAVEDKKAVPRNGPSPTPAHIKAAPSVRLMARKLGVDLTQVRGSGPQGRILVEDLTRQVQIPSRSREAAPVEPQPDYGKPGTRIKLQGLRRRIAEHMVLAKKTVPHYTYVDECDVTELVKLRESLKEPLSSQGAKITYLAFFVKAVARVLAEVPIVNSSLDDKAEEIVLHDQVHIGIAVATAAGLIVPVVRDANKRDLVDIAREVDRLSSEARAGKARLEDLRGGTFTITSIGNLGGLFATPIIHHPQVAILGIGKIVKRPVFNDQERVKAAHMLYLSLTCDHRVLDGAVATAFGNAIIKKLQNPGVLLLK